MILTCPSCMKRFLLDAGLLGQGRRVKCGQCGYVWFAEAPAGAAPAKPAKQDRPPARNAAPPSFKKPVADRAAAPIPEPPPARSLFDDPPDLPPLGEGAGLSAFDKPDFGSGDDDQPLARPMRPRPLPKGSNLPAMVGQKGKGRIKELAAWIGVTALVVGIGGGAVLQRDMVMQVWPASFRLYELVGLAEVIGTGLSDAGDPKRTKVEVRDVEGINLLFVSGEISNKSDTQRSVPDIQAVAYGEDGKELFAWRIVPPVRRLFPNQTTKFESRVPEREGGQAKNIGFRYIEPEAAAAAP
jgi:predicted Zn finger-like uncharacterized protein